MKILLDQGLPADAVVLFRRDGYECRHISELGMHRAEDEEILSFAHEHDWVVTPDADFHTLMAVQQHSAPSVVSLRREGCMVEAAVAILTPVLERYSAQSACGVLNGVLVAVLHQTHRHAAHRSRQRNAPIHQRRVSPPWN